MNPEEPIRLTHEELNSEENIKREEQLTEAKKVSQVRSVGSAPATGNSSAVKELLYLAAAGLVGGLISFGLNKILTPLFPEDDATVSNIAFTVIMAASIGVAISMVDAISTRSGAKVARAAGTAVPIALGAGLLIGIVANAYYTGAIEGIQERGLEKFYSGEILTEAEFLEWFSGQLHLPRGIAWLFVGVSAGVTAGLVSKSSKRLMLTSAGGALGGFLGGFIFDYITGEAAAQALGMSLTGLLVGLGMSAIEQATKSRWIEITQGGLAGKQFILYKQDLVIGASPQADITLIKDPQVPALALRISSSGTTTTAIAMVPGTVTIDGTQDQSWILHEGSYIQIGNTALRFREKSGATVPTEKINRSI